MLDLKTFGESVQVLIPHRKVVILERGIVGWDSKTRPRWYHGVRIDDDFDCPPEYVAGKIEASILKRLARC